MSFVGKLPEPGRRADLLRVVQWRPAGQCHAVRQMARQRPAEKIEFAKGPLRSVRLRQQRLGRRPISRSRGFIDDQLMAHGASNAAMCAARAMRANDLDGQFEIPGSQNCRAAEPSSSSASTPISIGAATSRSTASSRSPRRLRHLAAVALGGARRCTSGQ